MARLRFSIESIPLTLCVTVASLWAPALWASDIGGEVEPPPCEYNAAGGVTKGLPACAGPMAVTRNRGVGTISSDFTGFGGLDDPWLITEDQQSLDLTLEFTGGFGPALPFSLDLERPGNAVGTPPPFHWYTRYFNLTITNNSGAAWLQYEIELQRFLDQPSTNEGDSLSFGQISRNPARLFVDPTSSAFSDVMIEANDRDAITFRGGLVEDGETFTLAFMIADNEPAPQFFLQQRAAVVPEPATWMLTAGAAIAFVYLSRRRPRS